MKRTPVDRCLPAFSMTGIILSLVLVLAACGGESPTANPTAPPTSQPASTVAVIAAIQTAPPPQTATSVIPPTVGSPPATPGSTLAPTAEPASSLMLELLSPDDGAGIEVDAIRVMGKTRVDAVVGINGNLVEVSADGTFRHDLALEHGANLVEVVASTLSGEAASQDAAVFFISTAAGLPFTLFYPPDGLTVSEPDIPVFGGTSPEAVVGVNGIPVDINILGIFSTFVTLEEGANFIEVLATDFDGNVRFQTVGLFYIP